MTSIKYRDYRIDPRPMKLDAGGWNTSVQICRDTGSEMIFRPYSAKNVWPTEEEAIQQYAEFGRRIIDGEVPDLTPP